MLPAMQVSHTTGSIVFFAAILLISALTLMYLLAWLGRKVQRQEAPKRSGPARWTRRGVLSLAGIGIASVAWGYFREPYRLEVTRNRIVTPKLHGVTRPVRIVQISDMHCDPVVRNELKLPGLIASLKPDIIVYTGDSINSPDGLTNFRRCLTKLAKIAPTYVSRGNWDYYFGDLDYFGETGAIELNGANQRVDVAGGHFWISGSGILDGYTKIPVPEILDNALAGIPEEDFKIFLYHYPDLVHSLADRGVDLHFAGHTHGGQVAMPLYGALMTASRYGKKFEAGLYRVGNTYLYVNRGIGMEGKAPKVRFWCPPEVCLMELVPKTSATTSPA